MNIKDEVKIMREMLGGVSLKLKHFSEVRTLSANDQLSEGAGRKGEAYSSSKRN